MNDMQLAQLINSIRELRAELEKKISAAITQLSHHVAAAARAKQG